MQRNWKSKGLGILWLMCIFWLPALTFGETETVFLPVTLEYPFIRSVLVHQLYTAPGQRAIIVDEKQQDCIHIELSNPEVGRELSMIKVGSAIKIRAGVPLLGACTGLIEWEGYVEALQRLVLDEKSWQVRFETVESRVFDKSRKPVTIAGNLLDLIKAHVDPYLNQTIIELAPPIKEMKDFLPIFFLPEERRRVHRLIETLRPGPVRVEESAVKVTLQVEVETESKPRASAVQLSPSEIERISPDSGPASDVQEMDLPEELEKNAKPDDRQSWLGHFLFPMVWAKEGSPAVVAQIKQWIPSARDPNPYIGKVRNLLGEAADKVVAANPIAGDYNSFFHILVSATAWQESCWRQFLVQAGKIRYLISYDGSSVGLMQINERVWRGIYRVESLRWNTPYNVKAGCEILNLYLRNFALKEIKPANPPDLDTIAHVTYAMYNGGPGELKQYFKRRNAKKFYRSDRLFREKYTAAKEAKFDKLGLCFSGK